MLDTSLMTATATHHDLGETLVLKLGNVFAVTRRDGSLETAERHALGLYRDDCRHLSGHRLLLAGTRPRPLLATVADATRSVCEQVNAELRLADGRTLAAQTLRIRLERRLVADDLVEETLLLESYDRERIELRLELALAADFAPMLALRGMAEIGAGEPVAIAPLPAGVRFSVRGRDGLTRATTVLADRPCAAGAAGTLLLDLALAPGAPEPIRLRYELDAAPATSEQRSTTGRRRPPARPAPPTEVETDDARFDAVLARSLLDVEMLGSRHGTDRYVAAGVPWYVALFGRDALICATQMLAFEPDLAASTLRLLTRRLGTREDPAHDEEPGKVPHELRGGEVANLGASPLTRYYGTVDATPLALCLLCDHADWTGDLTLLRSLRGEIDAMLGWIDGPGDRDGDGLLDYARRAPMGLRNHGWKDSEDGVLDERGRPLEAPVTLVEPSAYALRAKRGLARLLRLDGDGVRADALEREADALGAALERFWLADRACYSIGWGADGRPSRALASNQGHLLWARAVSPARAAALRAALMSRELFSGWGIRTLALGEAGYNPLGYHVGSVWPHDTALIAAGLREYGFDADCMRLFDALIDAAAGAPERRLPELLAGYARAGAEPPVPCPSACRPQAWAAGAIPQLLAAGLGLAPAAAANRLVVRRPALPRRVDRLTIRGLRVGAARAELRFERDGDGDVALRHVEVAGDLDVVALGAAP